MKNIFDYLYKKVTVTCTDGQKFIGNITSMASSLEEDTEDPAYDSITIYDGGTETQLFRNEIADIEETEEIK